MKRVRGGWALTKTSWRVLREHEGLMRYPILAAVAAIGITVFVAFPGVIALLVGLDPDVESVPLAIAGGVALVAGVYLAVVVTVRHAVMLAASTDAVFSGASDPIARAKEVTRSRRRAIFGWALMSILVGVVLNVLDSIRGVSTLISALLGIAWGLVTFLAIPVVAFEGTGPIETVKRSGQVFRERWQGQVSGQVAIGSIVGLVGFLPAFVVIGVGIWIATGDAFDGSVRVGLGLVGFGLLVALVASIILVALRGVFGVALYRFAGTGEAVGPFTADELQRSVQVSG